MLSTQNIQLITKETQKTVLRAVCESPTLSIEELTLYLKSTGKSISQDEVVQVLNTIYLNKNWNKISREEYQKLLLEYLWTIEAQILYLLPVKQKETTVAEFNQFRLRNKQPKVSKDLIRHIQSLLHVDGKNLSKFRKFEKELSLMDDVDPNVLTQWAFRVILASLDISSISDVQSLPGLLIDTFREKFSVLAEKVGKTIQRITEKFVECYFPKGIAEGKLKELIQTYQSIYLNYKQGAEGELIVHKEYQDQNKVIETLIQDLEAVREIVNESHEGGFVSKLVSGKVKNREGIVERLEKVTNSLKELMDLNNAVNKANMEKTLLVQKLQSDYENVLLTKTQFENESYDLKEKTNSLEERKKELENELHDKTESLERAHEKIAELQQKIDKIPEIESKEANLREELNFAKDISLQLHRRLTKIKSDIQKLNSEKTKIEKQTNGKELLTIVQIEANN
ncbi:MAG: hypothetical protein HYR97_02685 [Candidatus Melainabacteria bacterium]|nr:hypothetical protein [Candidatus Melainabacteria bacterium]MBI3309403.1 hypothetical protein [Candidatus Melainabacteria bacterium]